MSAAADSFLASKNVSLSDVSWKQDSFGDYWVARFLDSVTGESGITGNYYDILESGKRQDRLGQEAELKRWGN